MNDHDLGELAYEAHRAFLSWRGFPAWKELQPADKDAWRAAARAVRMATEDASSGVTGPKSEVSIG
jgi:hypothetical protein